MASTFSVEEEIKQETILSASDKQSFAFHLLSRIENDTSLPRERHYRAIA
jgi:hypothetical protein